MQLTRKNHYLLVDLAHDAGMYSGLSIQDVVKVINQLVQECGLESELVLDDYYSMNTPWSVHIDNEDIYGEIDIIDSYGRKVCSFWQDDAPVEDFNARQHKVATFICDCVNKMEG